MPTTGRGVRPDVVFPGPRVAVFVDGCFWHSCPEHGTQPKKNMDYWSLKLRSNRERDARVTDALEAAGWHVIRLWEHEPIEAMVEKVTAALA